MLLSGRAKSAYELFASRAKELAPVANAGKLNADMFWRYAYYCYPYLVLETNEAVTERFTAIFANTLGLGSDGKISITPTFENNGRFGRIFIEVIEETNTRGTLTDDVAASAVAPFRAYFDLGVPLGVRMFANQSELPRGHALVKYTTREFAKEMLRSGRFRISPASYYSRGSHLAAARDKETVRSYKLKALRDVLEGRDVVEVDGHRIPITNGTVPVELALDDYYLFSTCAVLDRRLPTDFRADAALIITNKSVFVHRLKNAVLDRLSGWEFFHGDVEYFDPYQDLPSAPDQELRKNFLYAYQNEHRCVVRRPTSPALSSYELEPFFVELGSLQDIAELVEAP